ncbi:MAG: NADH-quinone oxidoreductase subunit C [Frankiales bacterium]|nr:NADH-quinone oxidoreductase subunit C [Frankiales bacterium]
MSVTPQGSPPAGPSPDGEVATGALAGPSSTSARADAVSPVVREREAGSDMFGATRGGDTSGFGGLVRSAAPQVGSPRPYGGWFDDTVDVIAEAGLDAIITRVVVDRGELTLHVDRTRVAELCQHLRDSPDQRYELLLGVSGVDFPAEPERLHVVYHLMSMTYRRRLRLETACSVDDPHVISVTGVYPTADFHERETWDMFGVVFDGHPALTRILMPDDWDGHPQRKDYPLGGVPVEYKGAQVPPPDERRSYA